MRLSFRNLFGPVPPALSVQLVMILGLWACDGQDNRPDGLIEPEKMATILTDIHIAEARVSTLGLKSLDSSLIVYGRLQADIYRRNKVDTSQYAQSYDYYATHPAILAEIYDQVDSNLAKRAKTKNIKF